MQTRCKCDPEKSIPRWVSAPGLGGSGMSEFCESRDDGDKEAIATVGPATFLVLRTCMDDLGRVVPASQREHWR
jgi:hypothetical protein